MADMTILVDHCVRARKTMHHTGILKIDPSLQFQPAKVTAQGLAVGERSARVLQGELGLVCLWPRHGHGGAALLAEHGERIQAGQQALVLAGEHSRDAWLQPLRRAGVIITLAELYRRVGHAVPLPDTAPSAVLATSGLALRVLSEQLSASGQDCRDRLLLLPAARLERLARELGWSGRIVILTTLSGAAVIEAMTSSP